MSSSILPRKRKQFSPSISPESPICAVARCQYRPRRACRVVSSTGSSQKSQLITDSSVQNPKSSQCPNLENGSSVYLSIKDLRTRARRVFSPTGSIEAQDELGFVYGEGISDGSLKNSRGTVSGFLNSELGSGSGPGSGFCASSEVQKEKSQNGEEYDTGSKHVDAGVGDQRPPSDKDVGMNKINQVVRKYSSRGKVYKSPSLFSYRRLLPFLADMVKEESCTMRSNGAYEDAKVENSVLVNSSSSSVSTDSVSADREDTHEDSNGTRPLNQGPTQEGEIQQEVNLPHLHDLRKELLQNEESVSLTVVHGRIDLNGVTAGNEVLIEERIHTTPPDSTILSELGLCNTEASTEVSLKTQASVVVHSSKGSDSSNHVSGPEKVCPSPTRRDNAISTTKLVLNPCSRSKIYKTSNSFSYRRLLPYLMDVAKGSEPNDPSPKFLKDVENSQNSEANASSDSEVNLNEIKVFEFQEKQHDRCLEVEVPTSTNTCCLEDSAPVINPTNEISLGKQNSACSENLSEPDVLNGSLEEWTSPSEHVQLNKISEIEKELHNVEYDCNQAVESSRVNQKTLAGESRLEGSHHKPLDTIKNCSPDDLICHESKLDWVKSVPSGQSLLKNVEFHFQRRESSTKKILQRNPRGCRGLCNCLNCSLFRLHAQRAFEFSKNQMLDAEELALMLISELGELRDMLQRSAVDGSDHSNIQVNQAKELCKKALAMEQQAKQRLSQMNEDLYIHCRTKPLERPRVKFSRYIEVKSIPEQNKNDLEFADFCTSARH